MDKMMGKENNKIEGLEFIICPKCYTKHSNSSEYRYCIECNYQLSEPNKDEIIKERPIIYAGINENSPQFSISSIIWGKKKIKDHPKWNPIAGVGVPLLSYILVLILTFISMILFIDLENIKDLENDMTFIFLTSIFSLSFLFVPTYWIKKYYRRPLNFKERLNKLGLPFNKYTHLEIFREVLFGILIGILSIFLVLGLQVLSYFLVEWIFPIDLSDAFENGALNDFGLPVPDNAFDLTLFILMILLFVGVPEEVLFRGFVQRSFEARWSKVTSLWLTAVYFTMFHIFIFLLEPALFLFLFIPYLGISLFLGLIRNWRKDLYAAVVAHIVYDISEIIILYSIFF